MSSIHKRLENSSFVFGSGCAVLVFNCFRKIPLVKENPNFIIKCACLVYFSVIIECKIACFILYSMLYLVFECSIYIIKAESDSLLGTACIWRQMCVKLSSFHICGHCHSEQRPLCTILRHIILKRHKDRRDPLHQLGSLKEKVNSTNFVRHRHVVEGMIQSGTGQKTTQDIHFL